MTYLAVSLAITAAGLILCYLLFHVTPTAGKTLNAVLIEDFSNSFHLGSWTVGEWFAIPTILSEAVLLVVAAQTGFIDGPRVMANMAIDSWLPRRFVTLSDRLTIQNGLLLIGVAAAVLLAYTRGSIAILVVMYSINVFVTFSLSQTGMVRFWIRHRSDPSWRRHLSIHLTGLVLCLAILGVMLATKLQDGGWITVAITCGFIALCFAIRRHYHNVSARLRAVEEALQDLPAQRHTVREFEPRKPTAILLVGGYAHLGIHCLLTIFRLFPETFRNVVFVSIGVIDSELFKGEDRIPALEQHTRANLRRYVDAAQRLGIPARSAYRIGTEVVDEAAVLCLELQREYPRGVVFAGEVVFDEPRWYDSLLHNNTSDAIQRRLRFAGLPVVILPVRLQRQVRAQRGAATPAAEI